MEEQRRTNDHCAAAEPCEARDVRVSGAVQGVGFRPFVHTLATSLDLAGEVRNTSAGVEVRVEGSAAALDAFVARLVDDAPPLALIEDLTWSATSPSGISGFSIASSKPGRHVDTLVTADAATCDDCLAEILDSRNRRYRYPFTNCTNCGPRFTITREVPYDRPGTTMSTFHMCIDCEREYNDPKDRRFHAQPNACSACGPQLGLRLLRPPAPDGGPALPPATPVSPIIRGDGAIRETVALLLAGGIAAVKGLGGYHLACDATNAASVATLRARKHRDEKPFAVMVSSVDEARRYCDVSMAEATLLASTRRPIVILERSAGAAALADEIAPGMTTYGLFLPYTPLHHLLLSDAGRPLVMTSGNLSDEPVAYQDEEAATRLAPLADALLAHDRPIHMRTDDSVARVFRSQPYLMRRSRGYAPLPVGFSGSSRQILAVGAHLKNTFCLTRGSRAFVSHHIGDLENLGTLRSLREGVDHFSRLFSLTPEAVVHDLHPDYLSSRFAREYAREHDLPLIAVQHHEAHVASVMADARYEGPVIGVAFDGSGLGSDGTIWGGEFLAGTPGNFRRVAHLELVPLPGSDAAVREPWRMAVALLDHLFYGDDIDPAAWVETDARIAETVLALPRGGELSERPWRLVLQAARRGIRTPLTSSVGRLFDGVSALLGLRHRAAYEGQAAILLEAAARRSFAVTGLPPPAARAPWLCDARHTPDLPAVLPVGPFVRGVLDELRAGTAPDRIAAQFHDSLAAATADLVVAMARQHTVQTVALGGGVFQNLLLLELLVGRLEAAGLRPLVHRAVPTNDGGLCLGQAEVAAALLLRTPMRT